MCDHPNREASMLLFRTATGKVGCCDPCLLPLLSGLAAGGVSTIASCCGHGQASGSIVLADHTTLTITIEYPQIGAD